VQTAEPKPSVWRGTWQFNNLAIDQPTAIAAEVAKFLIGGLLLRQP
jgi:hypothetical protein